MITLIAALVTAGLVLLFLWNLPGPPRFDQLRVDPGSRTTVVRGILRRQWTTSSEEPGVVSVPDVLIETWPVDERGRPAARISFQVPIERHETTFARFTVEGDSAAVRIRRGSVVILEVDSDSTFRTESDSVVIPVGTSDLEVEVIPRGISPWLRVTWREIEIDGEPRSLASLMESSGR